MQIIGHRGVSQLAPENSLKSFKLSLKYQQDFIELDVRCSEDGQPIVFHDARLWRLGKSLKKINQLKAADIQTIVLRSGATIPTLDQVMDLCQDKIKFDIELKDSACLKPTIKLIESLIAAGRTYDDFIISSLKTGPLYAAKKLNPRLRLVYIQTIFPLAFKKLTDLNLYGVVFYKHAAPPSAILAAQKLKLWTAVYTVNSRAEAKKFKNLNINAIISNLPNPQN